MEIDPVLSIIIPVYNMEAYVERCLLSLFDQDISVNDYEIIVINDGSVDKSKDRIINLKQKFGNLKLINQENQGVSVARNVGISSAKGKYLLFIDADDYVYKNSLSRLIDKADKEDLDVLYMNISIFSNEGVILGQSNYQKLEGNIFKGTEMYSISRSKKEKEADRSCGILYKRSFLIENDLKFLQNVPYLEDGLFGGKVLCLAERGAFDSSPFYCRMINPDSASRSNLYNTNRARQGFVRSALDIRGFKNKHVLDGVQLGLVNHLTAKFVISSIISSLGSKEIKEIFHIRRQLRQNGYSQLSLIGLVSNKNYVKSYNISFWCFILYYLFETRIRVFLNKVKGKVNERFNHQKFTEHSRLEN